MKFCAVILARGGSKGLSQKNIIDFCGKPLLAWTIEHCRDSGIDSIYVSSDSDKILEVGEEYGATTGRKRQVNWMNLNFLKKAININGVTHLVVNKMDVLESVNAWAMYKDGDRVKMKSSKEFKNLLEKNLTSKTIQQIYFSGHKDKI